MIKVLLSATSVNRESPYLTPWAPHSRPIPGPNAPEVGFAPQKPALWNIPLGIPGEGNAIEARGNGVKHVCTRTDLDMVIRYGVTIRASSSFPPQFPQKARLYMCAIRWTDRIGRRKRRRCFRTLLPAMCDLDTVRSLCVIAVDNLICAH